MELFVHGFDRFPSIVFVCVQSCTGRLSFCDFLNGEKPKNVYSQFKLVNTEKGLT